MARAKLSRRERNELSGEGTLEISEEEREEEEEQEPGPVENEEIETSEGKKRDWRSWRARLLFEFCNMEMNSCKRGNRVLKEATKEDSAD